MKKIIRLFSLALTLVVLQQNIFAQNDNDNDNRNDKQKKYEFVKNKTVNKSYSVSSSDKLKIENSFGNVEVHTWNKNEIKVDISIEVSSNIEASAQKMIDGITINDSKSGSDINFKTSIKGNDKGNHDKEEKSTMKINYDISMPASNPLNISNEFGGTVIPDFKGEVELSSKFGSLTTGTLTNVKILNVEFGSAKIESANGSVSIKYSSATIGKLVGNVKLNLEFSSATKINIDNSLTGLDAKVSYSTVSFKPSGGLSASYNISTSFGSFKNRTDIKFDGDDEDKEDRGPKFDHSFSGKSGSGSVPVKIKNSFGKVILGEPTADDLKDKEKNKNKNKTTS